MKPHKDARRPDRAGPSPQALRGMTLVELMVSIAIGMVMVLAMLMLYTNIARNQAQMTNTARQVENGRFALQLLQQDLLHAGFWGDYLPLYDDKSRVTPEDLPNALPDPCLAYSAINWTAAHRLNLMALGVQGYAAASPPAECVALLPSRQANTDILVVRHADTCEAGVGTCDADEADRLYLQSSRCTSEMAAGNRVVFDNQAASFTLRRNINCPAVAPAVDLPARKRRYVSSIYYVRNFAFSSGDGIPTLMRASFGLSGTTPAYLAAQPMIEGIEALRFEYGLDNVGANGLPVNYDSATGAVNRGDGVPDEYITCPRNPTTPCTHWDFFHTVAVRVHVLSRNLEPTPGHTDTKRYQLAGQTYGPYNDNVVRHVYSTTVRLSNPAGRREP